MTARVDDASYDRAIDILDDNGTIDISEREQNWRSEGWTGYDPTRSEYGEAPVAGSSAYGRTAGPGAATGSLGQDQSIPIAREDIAIGKRDVSHGRVRVRSYVVEEPVRESFRCEMTNAPPPRSRAPGSIARPDGRHSPPARPTRRRQA